MEAIAFVDSLKYQACHYTQSSPLTVVRWTNSSKTQAERDQTTVPAQALYM